jgi:hypothetical protein
MLKELHRISRSQLFLFVYQRIHIEEISALILGMGAKLNVKNRTINGTKLIFRILFSFQLLFEE